MPGTVYLVVEQGETSLEITGFANEDDARQYVEALRSTHDLSADDLSEDEENYFVYHGIYVGIREVMVSDGAAAKDLIENTRNL